MIDMDAETIALDAADLALTLLGLGFPPALPFIAIAKEAVPAFMAAKPYILKAISNGKSAIEAANEEAPQLVPQIKAIATEALARGLSLGPVPDIHLENVARDIFKIPRMTPEEEAKWMNDATPHVNDSTFGG